MGWGPQVVHGFTDWIRDGSRTVALLDTSKDGSIDGAAVGDAPFNLRRGTGVHAQRFDQIL